MWRLRSLRSEALTEIYHIDNSCPHEQLHFGMPGGRMDYKDEYDEINKPDAIPKTSQ